MGCVSDRSRDRDHCFRCRGDLASVLAYQQRDTGTNEPAYVLLDCRKDLCGCIGAREASRERVKPCEFITMTSCEHCVCTRSRSKLACDHRDDHEHAQVKQVLWLNDFEAVIWRIEKVGGRQGAAARSRERRHQSPLGGCNDHRDKKQDVDIAQMQPRLQPNQYRREARRQQQSCRSTQDGLAISGKDRIALGSELSKIQHARRPKGLSFVFRINTGLRFSTGGNCNGASQDRVAGYVSTTQVAVAILVRP